MTNTGSSENFTFSSTNDGFNSSTSANPFVGITSSTPPSRLGELLFLGGTIATVVAGFLTGFLHVVALWLASYVLTVFAGVTLLALYRRKLVARFAITHIAESRSSRLFQAILAVFLGSAAVLNAVHLAVKWSS